MNLYVFWGIYWKKRDQVKTIQDAINHVEHYQSARKADKDKAPKTGYSNKEVEVEPDWLEEFKKEF